MEPETRNDIAQIEQQRIWELELPWFIRPAVLAEKLLRKLFAVGVLGAVAFWALVTATDILSRPFAELSPLTSLGGILAGLIGIVLVLFCILILIGFTESRLEQIWRESQADKRRLLGYDTESSS